MPFKQQRLGFDSIVKRTHNFFNFGPNIYPPVWQKVLTDLGYLLNEKTPHLVLVGS